MKSKYDKAENSSKTLIYLILIYLYMYVMFYILYPTARDCRIDVVLIDTAGRMQDNEPLMRALSKVCYCTSCHVSLNIGNCSNSPPPLRALSK